MTNWKTICQAGARCARFPFELRSYADAAERLLLLGYDEPSMPQLFIIGLPRSGTTLVYQYIVHRLAVSYFTNGVGKLPKAPCLTTFWQRMIYGDYSSDFKSHYGKVMGPVAPREAGAFWARFFDVDDYVSFDSLSIIKVRTLQKTIACVECIFGGAPFVNKNVKHLLRIDAIRGIFRQSHFLVVERDRIDVALSLLRGKYEMLGDPKQWLSARPPDYDALKNLSPPEQVMWQLVSLNAKMETDISYLGSKNVMRLKYETFCDQPEQVIEMLGSSFAKTRTRNPAQEGFKRSKQGPRNNEEETLVRLVENADL